MQRVGPVLGAQVGAVQRVVRVGDVSRGVVAGAAAAQRLVADDTVVDSQSCHRGRPAVGVHTDATMTASAGSSVPSCRTTDETRPLPWNSRTPAPKRKVTPW